METDCGKDPLPHHEQQPLCTSRQPYRQGRKLTAVKVYTINNESNHLLVFGVPSINIRQETKNLFIKFGKLLKFNITKEYKTEKFTETYHAVYENIKSARIAKKYIDAKNFYGGTLHVCYAPELETLEETRKKLLSRKKDVTSRLKIIETEKIDRNSEINRQITDENVQNEINPSINNKNENKTLNMGYENVIYLNKNRKRKLNECKIKNNKQISKTKLPKNHNEINNEFCTSHNQSSIGHNESSTSHNQSSISHNESSTSHNENSTKQNEFSINYNQSGTSNMTAAPVYYKNEFNESSTSHNELSSSHNESSTNHNEYTKTDSIEIIDFTSTERDTISNINEALNYNKFGNEVIKKIENKAVNRIKFNFKK